MKNIKRVLSLYIIFIIIAYIIGYIIGINIADCEQKNLTIINEEYFQNSFIENIFILITTYILSVIVHELAHYFVFVIENIKIRAVILLGCIFIKKNNKWIFKFKISLIRILGGIVIPDYDVVEDKGEFYKLKNKMAKAIVIAPIVSGLLGCLSLSFGILVLKFVPSNMKATLFMFIVGMVVFSMIITISCFFQNEYMLGDFVAYKIIKNNQLFSAIQLYEYAIFSQDQYRVRKNNVFLRNLIVKELEIKLNEESKELFVIGIVDEIIQEYLIGIIEELPEVIKNYSLFIIENKESIINTSSNTKNLGVIIRIVYLLNKLDEKHKAIELYNFIDNNFTGYKEYKYYKKQLEHVLGICNNKDYLTNRHNIKTDALSVLWEIFDVYYEDEMRISGVLEEAIK